VIVLTTPHRTAPPYAVDLQTSQPKFMGKVQEIDVFRRMVTTTTLGSCLTRVSVSHPPLSLRREKRVKKQERGKIERGKSAGEKRAAETSSLQAGEIR
jgi:hypothetical protein